MKISQYIKKNFLILAEMSGLHVELDPETKKWFISVGKGVPKSNGKIFNLKDEFTKYGFRWSTTKQRWEIKKLTKNIEKDFKIIKPSLITVHKSLPKTSLPSRSPKPTLQKPPLTPPMGLHVFLDKDTNSWFIFDPKTFKLKDQIKQYGFKWVPENKRWEISKLTQKIERDFYIDKRGIESSDILGPMLAEIKPTLYYDGPLTNMWFIKQDPNLSIKGRRKEYNIFKKEFQKFGINWHSIHDRWGINNFRWNRFAPMIKRVFKVDDTNYLKEIEKEVLFKSIEKNKEEVPLNFKLDHEELTTRGITQAESIVRDAANYAKSQATFRYFTIITPHANELNLVSIPVTDENQEKVIDGVQKMVKVLTFFIKKSYPGRSKDLIEHEITLDSRGTGSYARRWISAKLEIKLNGEEAKQKSEMANRGPHRHPLINKLTSAG